MSTASDILMRVLAQGGLSQSAAKDLATYLLGSGYAAPPAGPAIAAVTAAADAPAGGVGAAAGGWDTAGHRDAAITTINQLRADVIALQSEMATLKSTLVTAGAIT